MKNKEFIANRHTDPVSSKILINGRVCKFIIALNIVFILGCVATQYEKVGYTDMETNKTEVKQLTREKSETEIWNEVSGPDDVETYLAKYPSGKYSSIGHEILKDKKIIDTIYEKGIGDRFVIPEQEFIFACGSYAALHGYSCFVRFDRQWFAGRGERLAINRMEKLGQFFPLLFEFLKDRTQQVPFSRERMAAAVQAGFYAKLGNPQPALGEHLSLNKRGAVVAYLEGDFFLQYPVFIREKIIEPGDMRIQPHIHAGRKYD